MTSPRNSISAELVWPSPESVILVLFTGLSSLELPGRPTRDGDDTLRELGEPEVLPIAPRRMRAVAHRGWFVEMDVASGDVVLRASRERGCIYLEDIDLGISARMVTDMKLVGDESDMVSIGLEPGDFLPFWGRDFLHRVTSVEGVAQRVMLLMSYEKFAARTDKNRFDSALFDSFRRVIY